MDKSILDNEESSSIEPSKLATEHSILVETKQIDVLSLPSKKIASGSENDKKNPPLDEQPLDDNWLALSRDWQAQSFEKTDIKELLKQTKRRTLWAKALLVVDIIATVALIIALVVGLYQGDWDNATMSYLAFCAIGSIVLVYYEIQIRLRIWQQSCDSPDKAVANAIAGVESSIKYIKSLKLSCWLLLPAANGYFYTITEASEKSPWPPFLVMNAFIVIMWLITHWFDKKRRKELAQLSSLQ